LIPSRGDIFHTKFDPATGKEMKGDHYALVVTPKKFNAKLKMTVVCPISGGQASAARETGFLVSLMGAGTRVDGNIHVHQMKVVDVNEHIGEYVESIPDHILLEVLMIFESLFDSQNLVK